MHLLLFRFISKPSLKVILALEDNNTTNRIKYNNSDPKSLILFLEHEILNQNESWN